jgi:Periplasmic binding proteins and sugar binding domain of LacI family
VRRDSVGIKEVAARAGVAVGTVSNVLNRPEVVASPTRDRVLRAIADLGFVRSEPGRQLRAGKSRTIAYVMLDAANPFFTDVAKGIEGVARAHGVALFICNSDSDVTREADYLALLLQQRVRGVLVTPVEQDTSGFVALSRRRKRAQNESRGHGPLNRSQSSDGRRRGASGRRASSGGRERAVRTPSRPLARRVGSPAGQLRSGRANMVGCFRSTSCSAMPHRRRPRSSLSANTTPTASTCPRHVLTQHPSRPARRSGPTVRHRQWCGSATRVPLTRPGRSGWARQWGGPGRVGQAGWARQGSNLRPRDYESPALTTELLARDRRAATEAMAPGVGLEPTT